MCGRVEVLAANTNLHQCLEVTGQLYVSASLGGWMIPTTGLEALEKTESLMPSGI